MSLTTFILLFAASFAGGMVNSLAGGGTLITFPVLLALGLDARTANATSTLALFPGSASAAFGFRRELKASQVYLLRLGAVSLVGGALGAWLLIHTPSEIFDRLVPFLILFATIIFAAGETLSRKLGFNTSDAKQTKHTPEHTNAAHDLDLAATMDAKLPRASWWLAAIIVQLLTAIYGGYFGAGIGIMMLASLGLLGITDIHRANALKNLLAVCINAVAAVSFINSGLVQWTPALIMAAGAIAGGTLGARLAHHLGKRFVRFFVIVTGLMIGLLMLWRLRA